MDVLLTDVGGALNRFGPAVLGVLAFLETAYLTGFFVPAGVALLFASVLASEGVLPLAVVVSWAALGAVVGDSTGYWLGRRIRTRGPYATGGWFKRTLATIDPRRLGVLRGRPLYAVTLARLIPFVRTLMPISAGRSDLTYARFLFYDLIGVGFWALSYVLAGYVAGESWRLMSRWVGGFWTGIFAIVLLLGALGRLRARRRSSPPIQDGDAPGAASGADAVDAPPEEGAKMLSIGLTGNVASGKSAVATVWAESGVPVLSADQLARDVVEPGTEGLQAVIDAFGKEYLAPDGNLNRSALRERVFRDDEARRTLEGILHPLIASRRMQWMERQRETGAKAVVYEIPLLFETGQEGEFDVIVFVDASDEIRLHRLVALRGIERADAERMMSAQLPPDLKRDSSHLVIENNGTREDLQAAARDALARILTEMGPGWPYAP